MARTLIIAHRGASYDAPENSLAAYRLAWEQGADGAEGGFHLTRDGRIVAIHDCSTMRTGGVDRLVGECTFEELGEMDVGRWKGEAFAGERMPLLEQVLALLPAGKVFYIEVKCGVEILEPLAEVVEGSGVLAEQLRVICFDAEVIAAAPRVVPGIKTHWLVDFAGEGSGVRPTPGEILDVLGRVGAQGVGCRAVLGILNREFIGELHSRGLEVGVWTVDDVLLARGLADAGVDSITTNRPGYLLGSF